MTRIQAIILASCLALGVAGYLAVGRPGMTDMPMNKRQEEIMAKIRAAPETLTPAETLARLERTVIEQPDAPEPHYFIGELLRNQNRLDDAARAYQSALRRDETYVPALEGLANILVEIGDGRIGGDSIRLYARAYALDPSRTNAGVMAALGQAQAGDKVAALAALTAVQARLANDNPQRPQVDALIKSLQERQD